jgi:Protein of unknown function (DUF4236)
MGFYIRKAFRLGPLRINLSRHGVGYSVGIRGARIGRSSQGRAYVHAGRGGLYYRKFLTPRAKRR